ncbi:MAG: hypothetical protein RSG23_05060 [Gordonibacter sp.]|uniref:hypothetical protein n=1 Tax=Gordonibacter sp. TaxID=1968902 RepID=UPI002FC5EBF1
MNGKMCRTCARKIDYYCDVTTWAVNDDEECSVPPEFGGVSWEPMACGTCALSVQQYGISGKLVCRAGACSVDPSTKCMIYECGATKLCYRKRSDSVEQAARDMLRLLKDRTRLGSKQCRKISKFADRLRTLGVEP